MDCMEIPTFQPRLKVLNREQALAIHTAALEILEKTGFKMEHPGALEMLAGAGCKVTMLRSFGPLEQRSGEVPLEQAVLLTRHQRALEQVTKALANRHATHLILH